MALWQPDDPGIEWPSPPPHRSLAWAWVGLVLVIGSAGLMIWAAFAIAGMFVTFVR